MRDIVLKYAKGLHPTHEGSWRAVLKEQPISTIDDVFKLYVLYQLIATQSADVKRGFSHLNDTLGLTRMSTHTQTADARLRIKQERRPSLVVKICSGQVLSLQLM